MQVQLMWPPSVHISATHHTPYNRSRSSEPGLFVRLFVCFSAACRQLDCADDEDAAG